MHELRSVQRCLQMLIPEAIGGGGLRGVLFRSHVKGLRPELPSDGEMLLVRAARLNGLDEPKEVARRNLLPVGLETHRLTYAMYAYINGSIAGMSANRGRVRRPDNVPTVLLQARVSPDIRDEVSAAAAASGVSLAFYLESLLKRDLAESGRLPIFEIRPQLEELPIDQVA